MTQQVAVSYSIPAEQPQPSIGRIVHVSVDPASNNGSDVAAAIITRVWSKELVNIRILSDSAANPEWKTSVALVANQQAAMDIVAKRRATIEPSESTLWRVAGLIAYWPERN